MATKADTENIRQEFGFGESPAGLIVVDPSEAVTNDRLRGQSHYIRRAFSRLKLDAVVCIDDVPTIYLKQFARPVTRQDINGLQQKFWNQGVGTLLVILDPTHLYIFSSMVLPSDDSGEVAEHPALVDHFEQVVNALESYKLVARVASGSYYREHVDKFKTSNTVDQQLLSNLGEIGRKLRRNDSVAERKRVHAFLGRVIFVCYLVDRGIVELQNYSFVRKKNVRSLLDLLSAYSVDRARDTLYDVFERLRVDFNGSMFETDLDAEKRSLTDDDIRTLRGFLSGRDLKSRQDMLNFWAYDFASIPVETISAIYEKFLEEEDESKKSEQGAFYTPRHLAEMVVNEATAHVDTLLDKRCLDPACGSGIFLVILFNRMAEEFERENPRVRIDTRLHKLLDVLESQLCGVDVNTTACRITCFSLYVAYLDQFDRRTLKELQQRSDKILPNLLAYKEHDYQNTNTPAIYEGNFFDPKLPIRDDFDIIVGNPPWVGRNQASDPVAMAWVESETDNPFRADVPGGKAGRKAVFLPEKQIAHAFMWKAPTHLSESGRVCMLLPIQLLLNQTDAFQRHWFAKMRVDRVFNLSDFRRFLFQDAVRPASIILFGIGGDACERHDRIEYVVPKVRQQDPRAGLIKVFPEDRRWLDGGDILSASREADESDDYRPMRAAVFWKRLQWGTPRDIALVDYLLGLECLGDVAGKPNEGKRWIEGGGFKPWYQSSFDAAKDTYGFPKPIPGELSDRFIETVDNAIESFVLVQDTMTLEQRLDNISYKDSSPSKDGFYRSPDGRIYKRPLVLINKGFSKFAYCDFDVFFQDSMRGISGDPSDACLLRFLVTYLKSRLAMYFSFHTAGSMGTERSEVRLHEVMRLPFPLPESDGSHKDAEAIVSEVAVQMKKLQSEVAAEYAKAEESGEFKLRSQSLGDSRKQRIKRLQGDLEPLVYRYFKLTKNEIAHVEDTCNIIRESATPESPTKQTLTTKKTTTLDRKRYANLLCKTLNKWSKSDQPAGGQLPFYFNADIATLSDVGMVMLTLSQGRAERGPNEKESHREFSGVIERLTDASSYEQGSFEYLRGTIFADRRKIRIIKQDMLGQWTRTAALNDADRVFTAIVQSRRKRR